MGRYLCIVESVFEVRIRKLEVLYKVNDSIFKDWYVLCVCVN